MPKDTTSQHFQRWIDLYEASLLRYVKSRILDTSQVEDILQDVWTKLIEHQAPENIQHVQGWLFQVAKNVMLDRQRKRQLLSFDDAADQELCFELWATQELPDVVLESTEFWEALKAELARLPPAQREVFIAHELEGTPLKVLSERTGTPINTLLARKRYAVLRLRKRFEHLRW